VTLKAVCDDCGAIEDAFERPYEGSVSRPLGWEQVARMVGKHTYWDDYCESCYPKHKPASEDDGDE
jgi:hypothetical protein